MKTLAGRLLLVVAALCAVASIGLPETAAAPARVGAQAPVQASALPPTATFNHLTTEQGLADQTASEITQDAAGFMWFGTFGGLDRWDGYEFLHFRHDDADEHSLSGNVIRALYTDRAGTVWVGARGAGLNRFDPRTQRFDHFRHDPADPHSLADDSPNMVYEDGSSALWIATEGGLSRRDRDSGTFTNYRHVASD